MNPINEQRLGDANTLALIEYISVHRIRNRDVFNNELEYELRLASSREDRFPYGKPMPVSGGPVYMSKADVSGMFKLAQLTDVEPCEFEGEPTMVYRIGGYVLVPEDSGL